MALTPIATASATIRQELLVTARRIHRVIFMVCGTMLLLTLVLTALTHPKWRSEMSVMVLLGPDYGYRSGAGQNSSISAVYEHDERLGTETGILASRDLYREVLKAVGLDRIYPGYLAGPGLAHRAVSAVLGLFGVHRPEATPESAIERAVPELARNLTTIAEKQGAIINIGFTNEDPAVAQRVLDTLEQEYLKRRLALFANSQAETVNDDVERTLTQLNELEAKLTTFKTENGISSFSTRLDILLHEQGDTENDLKEADSLASQNQARIEELKREAGSTQAQIVQSRDSDIDQRLVALRTSLDGLRGQREKLASYYRDDSEFVKRVDQQIAIRQSELDAAQNDRSPGAYHTAQNPVYVTISTELARAQSDLAAAAARQTRDSAQLSDLAEQIAALNDKDRTLTELERQKSIAEENYHNLCRIRDERKVFEQVQANNQGDVRVINPPTLPSAPEPTRMLVLASGLIITMATGLAMVVLANFFRRTFLLPASLERDCGIPILAVLPEFGAARLLAYKPELSQP